MCLFQFIINYQNPKIHQKRQKVYSIGSWSLLMVSAFLRMASCPAVGLVGDVWRQSGPKQEDRICSFF